MGLGIRGMLFFQGVRMGEGINRGTTVKIVEPVASNFKWTALFSKSLWYECGFAVIVFGIVVRNRIQ